MADEEHSSRCFHLSFSAVTFQEQTGKNVLLLPIGASDDGAHSQNEKFDISNYVNGVRAVLLCLWFSIHSLLLFADESHGRLFRRNGKIINATFDASSLLPEVYFITINPLSFTLDKETPPFLHHDHDWRVIIFLLSCSSASDQLIAEWTSIESVMIEKEISWRE